MERNYRVVSRNKGDRHRGYDTGRIRETPFTRRDYHQHPRAGSSVSHMIAWELLLPSSARCSRMRVHCARSPCDFFFFFFIVLLFPSSLVVLTAPRRQWGAHIPRTVVVVRKGLKNKKISSRNNMTRKPNLKCDSDVCANLTII